MHPHRAALCALVAAILAISTATAQLPAYPPTCHKVNVVPISPSQLTSLKWRGWGTTLGWWASWAGTIPNSAQQELCKMIFSKKHLGLNLVHYLIGGGGGSPALEASVAGQYTYTPGFKASAHARYNWSQDQPQRNILFAAKKQGARYFEALSYSPPAYMTISKTFEGSLKYGKPNIEPKELPRYASYLASVVARYAKLGLVFDYLCPTNEVLEGWWTSPHNQEGCNMSPKLVNAFYPYVNDALAKQKSKTAVSGIGSFTVSYVKDWALMSTNVTNTLAQIAVHSYRGLTTQGYKPDLVSRQFMGKIAKNANKPVVTSEWSPLSLIGSDHTKGLFMASQISMDINVIGIRSFSIFQAVSQNPGTPAYIYTPFLPNGQHAKFKITPFYHYMLHYTRWIRPGFQFFIVPDGCLPGLVAGYDRKNKRLIFVANNMNAITLPISFALTGFRSIGGNPARMVVYRTKHSAKENHKIVARGLQVSVPGNLNVNIDPKSLTTFVIRGVSM